jgi:hypothetical protein
MRFIFRRGLGIYHRDPNELMIQNPLHFGVVKNGSAYKTALDAPFSYHFVEQGVVKRFLIHILIRREYPTKKSSGPVHRRIGPDVCVDQTARG